MEPEKSQPDFTPTRFMMLQSDKVRDFEIGDRDCGLSGCLQPAAIRSHVRVDSSDALVLDHPRVRAVDDNELSKAQKIHLSDYY